MDPVSPPCVQTAHASQQQVSQDMHLGGGSYASNPHHGKVRRLSLDEGSVWSLTERCGRVRDNFIRKMSAMGS